MLNLMNIDTELQIKTDSGNYVDIKKYDAILGAFDLYISNGQYDRIYNREITVSMPECNATKEMEQSDLIVMYIEEATNEIHFAELEDYDQKTGEMTITLKGLGAIFILAKVE